MKFTKKKIISTYYYAIYDNGTVTIWRLVNKPFRATGWTRCQHIQFLASKPSVQKLQKKEKFSNKIFTDVLGILKLLYYMVRRFVNKITKTLLKDENLFFFNNVLPRVVLFAKCNKKN